MTKVLSPNSRKSQFYTGVDTQQRQLVELLVDCVIVTDEQVELRYVIPTGSQGETTIFRHLRSDYLPLLPPLAR